jgi:hypothetical protein
MEAAGADTSEQPIADLRRRHTYAPQQQQLEIALKNLGGITKLLRDPLAATIRLQSLLHHLPSGSNIDTLLQQEIDHYLSSQLWFSDNDSRPGSRESSFYVSSTATGSGGGGVGRAGSNGGSGGGMLWRQSSLGPGRRPATLSVVEPFMVLRNDTVRSEWRGAFGGRERVTWKEFWYKLVQPQVRCGCRAVCGTLLLGCWVLPCLAWKQCAIMLVCTCMYSEAAQHWDAAGLSNCHVPAQGCSDINLCFNCCCHVPVCAV